MKTLLAPAALILSLVASIPAAAQQVVLAGQQSGIKEKRFVVARTAEELAGVWKQHAPAQAVPAVDFSKEIVVGVFLGRQNTAGTKVKLDLLQDPEDKSKLVVFYEGVAPSQKGFTAQVLTSPYELRTVPRGYASVAFERNMKARALVQNLQEFEFGCY